MKKILSIFLMLNLLICFSKVTKPIKASEEIIKYAKSAILIEAESGEVLYEYHAHERKAPASMTKVMTMKLILDAIKTKRLTFSQVLTTSEYASSMGGSQIYLEVGEKMKVEDLFKSMVIASANDCAVVLSEAVSGSENFFVNQMNSEVKKLGLKNTHYANCTGLPVENHYTSAFDMAYIARSLLLNYEEEIIPYTSCYEDYVRQDTDRPFWLVNTNKLIKNVDYIDGLKTGWTEESGYCLTSTGKKDGMRLIAVVMDCDDVKKRTIDTMALLDYGFANYEKIEILKKGTIIEENSSLLFSPNNYKIKTSNSVVKVCPKNSNLKEIKVKVSINEKRINDLFQYEVGKAYVYVGEDLIGSTDLELEVPVQKVNFWNVLWSLLQKIL